MKKNNKGFTLIELLAALVILGLLIMLSLPRLTEAITSSKDKVYVSDAKRLIAQTEYKVKVNSSVVELPSEGNCVVVGLRYLDASDFDSPPNDGEYLEEQSFAVIKNNSGSFEYSARLVEEYKSGKGYKGIQLSTSSSLDYMGGLKCVKSFENDEVSSSVISMGTDEIKTYVNSNLGPDYCSSVENIYNELDLDGSSVVQSNDAPKITSATLTSSESSKNFNSFKFDFKLRADDDGGRDKLQVCRSFDSYYDANNNCIEYNKILNENGEYIVNENGVYIEHFDYSNGRSYATDNAPVILYFIVKDQQGASVRRQISYEFHKNEAPVIDKETSTITSSTDELYNGINTVITLNVSDDITDVSKLKVCLDEGDTGRCSNDGNYLKYSDYFGSSNRMDYKINASSLDGSTHIIVVHVKDEYDVEATPLTLSYTLYNSTVPDFQGDDTEGSHIKLTPVEYNHVLDRSLSVNVSFTLLDKLGDTDGQMYVRIAEVNENGAEVKPKTYNYQKNGSYHYLFGWYNDRSGNELSSYKYEGQKLRLKVTVYKNDPYTANSETIDYTVYRNTPPKVQVLNVANRGSTACVPGYRCDVYNRNTYEVFYMIKIEDDIDIGKDLLFCVSENYDYCNSNPNNYVSFSGTAAQNLTSFEYTGTYDFDVDPLKPYQGDEKNIYFFVKDTYGPPTVTSPSVSSIDGGYKLYENQAPFIDILEVMDSEDNNVSSGGVKIKLSPKLYSNDHLMFDMRDHGGQYYFADDLTDNKYLGYAFYLNGSSLYSVEYSDLSLSIEEIEELKNNSDTNWDEILTFDKILNNELELNLSNRYSYDGSILNFKLVLTDSYGEQNEFTSSYQLYNNKPPTIDRFLINSSEPACDDCGDGGYTVGVKLTASDDLDSSSDLLVCITEDLDKCTNSRFISYADFFENKVYNYTFLGADSLTPYMGQTKHLYVSVMDKYGGKTYDELTYTVYENSAPTVEDVSSVSSQNPNFNSRAAIFSVNAFDDLGNLYERVCYAETDEDGTPVEDYHCGDYGPYSENFKFTIDNYDYNGQNYSIYAEIKDDYDKKVSTGSVMYSISYDLAPIVDSVGGRYNVPGYSGQGVVSFKATDYGDTFNVCVTTNSNGSGCSYNSRTYDGSSEKDLTYVYTFGSNPQNNSTTYYLFVKDSHGKTSNKSFKFSAYSAGSNTCEQISSDYINVSYTPRNANDIMNSDKCLGRCYFWPKQVSNGKVVRDVSDTYQISSSYNKIVSYRDKFNENKLCDSSTQYVSLNCGSIECFNTGNASNKVYNGNYVIGLEEHIASEDWFYFGADGEQVLMKSGSRYYNMYVTRYNEGDSVITLDKTSYYVPVDMIDQYKYSTDAEVKYLRALDSEDIVLSKPAYDTVKAKVIAVEYDEEANRVSVGDKVVIGTESYHVISNNGSEVALLSDYNVLYGNIYNVETGSGEFMKYYSGDTDICRQDPDATGWRADSLRFKGVNDFNLNYWVQDGNLLSQYGSYPAYVYESSKFTNPCPSIMDDYFKENNINYNSVKFMSLQEARAIGCTTSIGSCPSWASNGTYWLGTAADNEHVYVVQSDGRIVTKEYLDGHVAGFRYVVTINNDEINFKS